MLEAGLRLQEAGLRGVGVATREKEAHWKILHRTLQQEHDKLERKWTLRSRCGKFKMYPGPSSPAVINILLEIKLLQQTGLFVTFPHWLPGWTKPER